MATRRPSQLELVLGSAPAQLTSLHQYRLDDRWIEYTLKRSLRRRSITFTIDENGLRVGAPWRASQRRIEALLDTHARWIGRKLAEWQGRQRPPFVWQEGATVMVLGEPLTLTLAPACAYTDRDGNRLCVPEALRDPRALAAQVVAWLRDTAQGWFEQRAEYYAPVMDVQVSAIRLSNARTRWGTCRPDGRIHLNWRLIQMPQPLIDYVVVHELAHLREPNHSQRFWRWVAGVLPDYQQRRLTLRREGHRYLLGNV